jgi:hypothetical protein
MESAQAPAASATNPLAADHRATAARAGDEPQFELGILFVHGVGIRQAGKTFVRWGDALLKTIEDATRKSVSTFIEHAGPARDPSSRDNLEAVVAIVNGNETTRWLIREAEWANSFPPPGYAELVSWSFKALPWAIVTHIAGRYWQSSTGVWGYRQLFTVVRAICLLLITLLLTPIFIAAFAAILLLGLIPQTRTLALSIQSLITITAGDGLAFVESPVRAALIRTCILDALEKLKSACRYTVVVAHSQGAAIVMDALGGISGVERPGRSMAVAPPVPDVLVTFGSGTNMLSSLRVLASGEASDFNPASLALWSLLGVAGSLLWFLLRPHDAHNPRAAELTFILIGILGTLITSGLSVGLLTLWPGSKKARLLAIAIIVIFILGWIYSLCWFAWSWHMQIIPIVILVLACLVLIMSLYASFSAGFKKTLTAGVRSPPGLGLWIDLYATADPVPNGPTRSDDAKAYKSFPIWNVGTPLSDHTSYWDNRDGFVLRVVRICAETARSTWGKALPDDRDIDTRGAWRVLYLRIARVFSCISWLVVGALLWGRREMLPELLSSLPVWVPWPEWLYDLLSWPTTFLALVAAGMWAWYRAQRWIWSKWVASEQDAVLAHERPKDRSWFWMSATAFSIAMSIVAMGAVAILIFLNEPADFSGVIFNTFLMTFLTAYFLLELMPPPKSAA